MLLTRGVAADPGATPVARRLPPQSPQRRRPPPHQRAAASSAGTSPFPTRPGPSASSSPTRPPAAPPPTVRFRAELHALLPGNTEAAFAQLGSGAQAASGGRAGFERFYGEMESVSLQNVRRTGDNTAEATVVFVRRGGGTSSEPYRFVMSTGPDGRMIMESFSRA